MYKYYLTLRGFSIGTFPDNGKLVDHGDYDRRTEVLPGIRAWSWVTYSEPLTAEEISRYELVPDPDNSDLALPLN